MQLKAISLFLVIALSSVSAKASYLTAYLGPKAETYTEEGQTERSRTNPLSLLIEWGIQVRNDWYLSVGATGEVSLDDFSSRGFGINFLVKKYFFGKPSLVEQSGIGSKISLAEPYGVFVGGGFFHKNIRFNDNVLGDLDINVGGPALSFGGHYNWTKRYFWTAQGQYLISGLGSSESYQSVELYVGIGFRL
jgi:hypothetical protein